MTATTPEAKRKTWVKALLKRYGVYNYMAVPVGYGKSTLDFLCCHKGRFFAVETKRGGKDLTPRQKIIKEEIEDAGGVVFRVREREDVGELEKWIASL